MSPTVGGAGPTAARAVYFERNARTHRGGSGSPVLARRRATVDGRPRRALLDVHSNRVDVATREALRGESPGLNGAWYADILPTLASAAAERA